MSSDTPRTDSKIAECAERVLLIGGHIVNPVDGEFAEGLERDLAAANECILSLKRIDEDMIERAIKAEAERDALKADAERYRYLRQVDRCMEWENLLMIRPITRTEDIDAAIDAAKARKP